MFIRTFAVLFTVLLLAGVALGGDHLDGDNISETNGFEVSMDFSKMFIYNDTGEDAFNITILVYDADQPYSSFEYWDNKSSALYRLPLLPAGFKASLQKPSTANTMAKFRARVYCVTEYTGEY